jgi:hypothetical protein
MSHVVNIDFTVLDLDALEAAARQRGLELVRGRETFKWYGHHVGDYPLPEGFTSADMGKCEHVLRVARDGGKAYEIGLVRRRDGAPGWTLMFDFFGAGGRALQAVAGAKCSLIRQAYSAEVTRRQAARHGWRVQQSVQPDGSLRLVMTR